MIKIYHNPRCSKSRQALNYLEEKGQDFEVIKYLNDVPTEEELTNVLVKLNMKPLDIIRKGEQIYKEKFKGKKFTDEEWITIMIENPKLIERPIIVRDNKAVIARPLDNLAYLLGDKK